MKTVSLLFTLLMLFASSNILLAQHTTSSEAMTVSQVEDSFVSKAEHALVPLAEAMPGDKYSFAPTNGQFKGVRTFAEMVKHVAVSNYGMASAILHQDPPVKLDTQADVDAITGKAEVLKFLKGSFEFLHKALSTINEKNVTEEIRSPDSSTPLSRLEVAERAITHCWDHHGQLVEYLRMNGIVPPGSN